MKLCCPLEVPHNEARQWRARARRRRPAAHSTMPGYLYRTGAPFDVQLVIFGKDGTLLDSEAVRLPALKECTAAIAHAAGEPALLPALLKAGGWEDTEKGPTLAPDSVMACGTTLELAQRWIDTQPIVAGHWHDDAATLCAEMEEVCVATRPSTHA